MRKALHNFLSDTSAVSSIEYALLGGLIAVVIVSTVGVAAQHLVDLYTYVRDQVVLATS